jgi:hypothetical protein
MLKLCCSVLTVAFLAASPGVASAQEQSKAPAGAYAYFVNLHDGDTVTGPFKVNFGLTPNMGIAPSGVEKTGVGHFHLIVDTKMTAEEMTQPIMVDEHHIHFGKGQIETMLTLPPGQHTLQLMLGDWTHIPFNPPVQSEIITITVKAGDGEAKNAEPAGHSMAVAH